MGKLGSITKFIIVQSLTIVHKRCDLSILTNCSKQTSSILLHLSNNKSAILLQHLLKTLLILWQTRIYVAEELLYIFLTHFSIVRMSTIVFIFFRAVVAALSSCGCFQVPPPLGRSLSAQFWTGGSAMLSFASLLNLWGKARGATLVIFIRSSSVVRTKPFLWTSRGMSVGTATFGTTAFTIRIRIWLVNDVVFILNLFLRQDSHS